MPASGFWTWRAAVAFYRETLGLTPQRELTMEDRGWHLVFLGDGVTPFQLELCRELQRTEPTAWGMTPPMWPSCPRTSRA